MALGTLLIVVNFFLLLFLPIPLNNVQLFAHRGLSAKHYENTADAFLAAAQSDRFYGIETDVRITADGAFVCSHDANPFRDSQKQIADITLAEALSLPLRRADLHIATFAQFLEICATYNKAPMIEFKSAFNAAQIAQIIGMTIEKNLFARAIFTSFDMANLDTLRTLPHATAALFISSKAPAPNPQYGICVNRFSLRQNAIRKTHAANQKAAVYTVNSRLVARHFIGLGVDYIITDKVL